MSIIDYTRSRFNATASIWTDDFQQEVGDFVVWREGQLCATSYVDATFLGIVLSARKLHRPDAVEVVIALAGEVYTTMYETDQNWAPKIAAHRPHGVTGGALCVAATQCHIAPIDSEITFGPGPGDPFIGVKFDTTPTLPQEFLDERVGITLRDPPSREHP